MPTTTSKTGKKRVITDKRRQQGREAQKRYRDKQRASHLDQRTLLHEPQQANAPPTSGCEAFNEPATQMISPEIDELLRSLPDFSIGHSMADMPGTMADLQLPDPMSGSQEVIERHNTPQGSPSQHQGTTSNSSGVSTPAIPMDSYIRVQRYTFYAATVENAIVLGISFEDLQSHQCGDNRLRSPWRGQTGETALLDVPTAPDLAATPKQRSCDHDLYIDTLPFKDFREKLLGLRSVEPKIFDEDDFIRDLDFRDAFQCWGPTPWQSRSWEVQPWFLRKWWMITGGEHGEMATSSRWWRMFRGELN